MRSASLSKQQATQPQQQPLPLEDRLYRAGQHVVRARLFLDLWFYFEQKITRDEIIETMREYNEFFRFTPHAYFVSYVIHIAAMFDRAKDTISLTRLAREMKAAQRCVIVAAKAARERYETSGTVGSSIPMLARFGGIFPGRDASAAALVLRVPIFFKVLA